MGRATANLVSKTLRAKVPPRLYVELENELRYKVVQELAKNWPSPMTTELLAKSLDTAWSTVDYHLKVLERANLIRSTQPMIRTSSTGTYFVEKPYTIRTRALFEYGLLEVLLTQEDGVAKGVRILEEAMRIHSDQTGLEVPRETLERLVQFLRDNLETELLDHIREYVVGRISREAWALSKTRVQFVPFFAAYMLTELSEMEITRYLEKRVPSIVDDFAGLVSELRDVFDETGLFKLNIVELMKRSLGTSPEDACISHPSSGEHLPKRRP